MWYEERNDKGNKDQVPRFSLCCQQGKVLLPRFKDTPEPLKRMLDYTQLTTSTFRDLIRVYNVGTQPRYAQLWSFDTHNEIQNRLGAFMDTDSEEGVDGTIVGSQIRMLDTNSAIAKSFWMARDWFYANVTVNVKLHLLSERTSSKQYNAPTIAEVAALITNDFGDGEPTRDIVVCQKDNGYHEQIPYHTKKWKRKTARDYVTMKEYYAYVIQYRKDQCTTLHKGGRLFQQYLVDAFTAIEEQRLSWTRNNQDTLRVDLYHNVVNAITWGDTDATGLGKIIVLPISFTGGPRYMMQNYQDAMGLCHAYGNLDLFITFSSNPKWPEMIEMLAYIPGQRAHDRPKVGAMVFKLKLTKLLDDLTKNHVFGVTRADQKVTVVDEIKNYLNCRYLAPCENQQPVTLHDTDCLSALLQKEDIDVTMFTDWFDLNERHLPARTLTYAQISKHYVWHDQEKKWKPRKQRKCIGRIVYSTPSAGERYFLRMLLNVGGTGKTFLYKTIISRLRSELKIILAVASSGIASLLLPGGRTAHSSALDTRKQMFNQWVLAVGDGKVPARIKDREDEPTWIEIPETILIPSSDSPIQQIVKETYPNFIQRQKDDAYLRERAILTPINDDADAINAYMFDKLAGQAITYHSADEICKGSTEALDQHNLYPTEFLNTLNFQGMPPRFNIKKGTPNHAIKKCKPKPGPMQ
nr:hypothetical protein CTI12_AA123990 [Tanacetum cinerariifolium]